MKTNNNNNNENGKGEVSGKTRPHLYPKPTQNTSQQNNISKPDINTFSDSDTKTTDQLIAESRYLISMINKRYGL